MQLRKILGNALGMTLVEVMMGVAISGGLALTIAKMMENSSQNMKQVEAKSESINLKNIVQNTLSNTDACKYTFNPLVTQANLTTLTASPTNSVTVPSIKDKANAIAYSTASTNIRPLTITSIVLTNYNAATGTGDMVIQSTFRRSASQIQPVKPIRIVLNFNINNSVPTAPVLNTCSSAAVDSGAGWELAGNAGTTDGTDFIGTTDNVPLNFRVNNQASGRMTSNGTTFMGYLAGANLTSGVNNTAFGYNALTALTTGNRNTAIGYNALMSTTTGQVNIAIGENALRSNVTANHNIAIGYEALYNNTGTSNIAIGRALLNNTTANDNTAVGFAALHQNTTGINNVAIGTRAASNGAENSNNTAIGYEAFSRNTTGIDNVAVGSGALINARSSYNTGLGREAGAYISSGSYNTMVGYRTGAWAANMSGSNNVIIGARAGNAVSGIASASNKLYIEAANNTNPLISGDFSTRTLDFTGKVGIGRTSGSTTSASSNLTIGNPPAENNLIRVKVYDDSQTSGLYGLHSEVRHTTNGGGWVYALTGTAYNPGTASGWSVGVRANASAATGGSSGRAYGLFATAGNATPGYNYATVTLLTGDAANSGTALFAGSDGVYPQDMESYNGGSPKKWAAIFVGDTYHTGNSSAVTHTNRSDVRLKKDIKTLDGSLGKVLKLRGVSYKLKEDKEKLGKQVGLIAQEVEKEFPEVVHGRNIPNKMREVNYSALVAPLIEAIKELYGKLLALVSSDEKQNQMIKAQGEAIKDLKAENEKLKQQMKLQQESFDQRMKKLEAGINAKRP